VQRPVRCKCTAPGGGLLCHHDGQEDVQEHRPERWARAVPACTIRRAMLLGHELRYQNNPLRKMRAVLPGSSRDCHDSAAAGCFETGCGCNDLSCKIKCDNPCYPNLVCDERVEPPVCSCTPPEGWNSVGETTTTVAIKSTVSGTTPPPAAATSATGSNGTMI